MAETKFFKLHKSQVFLILLVSFLVGVFAGRYFNPQFGRILFFAGGAVAIVLATIAWGNARNFLLAGVIVCATFGVWHFQNSQPTIDASHIAFFNDGGELTWEGIVVEEPDARADRVNLTVEAVRLFESEDQLGGKALVTVGKYPEYRYGDRLKITGKLETPFETEEFSYKNYLSKEDIHSTSRFAEVELVARDQASPLKAGLLQFKATFSDKLSLVVPEPQNSLLLGLLVGARRSIPEDLLEQFRITGVTHIIAISGFNISIITRLLGSFIQRTLGVRASLLISILTVLGFVVITGGAASVVRAAIMGILVVLALNLGRASTMLNALVLTAAVMVAVNPQILVFDVGFQLSFLATAGLIYFADAFERFFQRVPKFFGIRSSLAATLSAQIFVLPLLIYYFDSLSLVAPLANVLILPIIPWAMFFGFVSGLLALVFLPLSFITAWITWAFLSYQIKVVELISEIPYASVAIENLPILAVVFYYLLLLIVVIRIAQKKTAERILQFQNA